MLELLERSVIGASVIGASVIGASVIGASVIGVSVAVVSASGYLVVSQNSPIMVSLEISFFRMAN